MYKEALADKKIAISVANDILLCIQFKKSRNKLSEDLPFFKTKPHG